MSWLEDLGPVLNKTHVSSLTMSMRHIICSSLNGLKIRETDDNIERGVAQQFSLDEQSLRAITRSANPTERLLVQLEEQEPKITIMALLDSISHMTRFDIIDDLHEIFVNSLPDYTKKISYSNDLPFNLINQISWKTNFTSTVLTHFKLPSATNLVALSNIEDDGLSDVIEIARKRHQLCIDRGKPDIDCNFLISPDGTVFEGTGWESSSGFDGQFNCIILAFIGKYQEQIPDERMMKSAEKLLEYGVRQGFLDRFYRICEINQIQEAESGPGIKIMDVVKFWSHFEDQSFTSKSVSDEWNDNDTSVLL